MSSNSNNTKTFDNMATTVLPSSVNNIARNAIVALILCVVLGLILLTNLVYIIVYSRVRRLRKPIFYLVLSISVADLLSAVFWVLPALISATQWRWILGPELCQLSGYVALVCYVLNAVTFLAIAFEKFMRFFYPSRHRDAFKKNITLILLFALWLFALVMGVVAAFVGWGTVEYIGPHFQCNLNYTKSWSVLNFMLIVTYIAPCLGCIIFFSAAIFKVKHTTAVKVDENGEAILEERKDRPVESFAEKLKRQHNKFRDGPNKDKKPTISRKGRKKKKRADASGNNKNDDGYSSNDISDDSTDFESDDSYQFSDGEDEWYHDYSEGIRKKREYDMRMRQQRVFRLKVRDLAMTRTMFIAAMLYFATWLSYVVLYYLWVYDYFPKYIGGSEAIHTVLALFPFLGTFYKPFVYMCNNEMRRGVREGIKGKKKKDYNAKFRRMMEREERYKDGKQHQKQAEDTV